MQSNDNAHGQNRRRELAYLPVPVPRPQPKEPRFAALRALWSAAWEEGGRLHEMWEDVLRAPEDGFRYMAPWIRAVLAVAGLSVVILMARAAGEVILQALHQLLTAVPTVKVGVDTSSGVLAVADQPVRTYIAQHAAGLPVAASTVYTLWLATGITGLVLGFLTRNNGARSLWAGHGAVTMWMVWTATPHTSRPVAAGLTILAWTVLSAVAMRGLTLRRPVAGPVEVTVRPEIHISVPVPAAPADHQGCPFRD